MSMVVVDFVATLVITRLKQILVSRKKKEIVFWCFMQVRRSLVHRGLSCTAILEDDPIRGG
jgi:hypothetical protein